MGYNLFKIYIWVVQNMFSYVPLWKKLLDEDINKTDLRIRLGLSPATMAKMSKNEIISMHTLDQICGFFHCQPNEIIRWQQDTTKRFP